ncbi:MULTISPECIES: pseudaminic acid cytidylyltransferase [unclassified Pseudomonas]|uniref:pseudaminic acid cytidylyltransferase n=1 Tax=unclassified Pseudomonas TaxID=196821 RepID=UPI002AC8AF94|nr:MULTISPECIES: pseudaminic acid cytidylyltransferase [unclassified Pseudomonas]MEB0041411.1 pseudaminic acid cytidylyltransferase [Pseudomonas sp. MH10]MEB0078687.1 pseudaminic acid cytidylyltransferase [Pseudomonas sp. MH10out]MEB0093255.1 pseudaminic acid cytidylyltransferase [Pseudomonas sp. CCI4.2]MEB0103777.1 pseudaminic acid cytidylyltransferase [Pseudomonas sp. CCI3.2]MEB0121174.1 pseudaminic acid cytidylyltransferase [Pseudomonas sp. CCI1.2]
MTAVAIIPARGGSKRIARKNLKLFNGEPMIVWSIRAALKYGLFDQVVVSTDDDEIAAIARANGAQVPFIRPARLADDFTGTAAVIVHALTTLQEQGQRFEYACCIYATAPLLQARYLAEGLTLLKQHPEKSYAFSVCGFGFAVQRALGLTEEGALQSMYPQFRETRSQDLPVAYQDAGQFYWGRSEAWLRGDVLFSEQSLPVILPRHLVQDIDNEEDWTRAEYLYAALLAGGELAP